MKEAQGQQEGCEQIPLQEDKRLFYLDLEVQDDMRPMEEKMPIIVEWASSRHSAIADEYERQKGQAIRLCLPCWDIVDEKVVEEITGQLLELVEAGFPILVWVSLPCHL